jgi:hypothetical protein
MLYPGQFGASVQLQDDAPNCPGYNILQLISSVQLQDDGQPAVVWTHEAEETPLLEAVAREWLVKTKQAGKGLVGAVEICGGAVIICTSKSCV